LNQTNKNILNLEP